MMFKMRPEGDSKISKMIKWESEIGEWNRAREREREQEREEWFGVFCLKGNDVWCLKSKIAFGGIESHYGWYREYWGKVV